MIISGFTFHQYKDTGRERKDIGAATYFLYHIGLENQKAYKMKVTYKYRLFECEIIQYLGGEYHYHIEYKDKMLFDSRLGKKVFNTFVECHEMVLKQIISYTN